MEKVASRLEEEKKECGFQSNHRILIRQFSAGRLFFSKIDFSLPPCAAGSSFQTSAAAALEPSWVALVPAHLTGRPESWRPPCPGVVVVSIWRSLIAVQGSNVA